jgi:hypothetical protein
MCFVLLDSVLRFVNGTSMYHYSGMRRDDKNGIT